jgi:hypothetical protein
MTNRGGGCDMDDMAAIKIAARTTMRHERRSPHTLTEQELQQAWSFLDLVVLELCDRRLSRAVLARAQYEAEHPQKGSKRTAEYMELLNEQLNCTRQLVELLKNVTGRWVYSIDGKYVLLTGVASRSRRLQRQARRLSGQRSWFRRQARTEAA